MLVNPPLWNPGNQTCGRLSHACLPGAHTDAQSQIKTGDRMGYYAKEEAGPIGLGEIYSSKSQIDKTVL